eukprot:COSAG05_NODE_564_length_8647_cov_65.428872_2_plen_408_part_00
MSFGVNLALVLIYKRKWSRYIIGDGPTDYSSFITFLNATQSYEVDGRQLRVWMSLRPPGYDRQGNPMPPAWSHLRPSMPAPDDPRTDWFNETQCFTETGAILAEYNASQFRNSYLNYAGWGCVAGELATRWPHLVQLNLEEFDWVSYESFPSARDKEHIKIPFPAPLLAEMTAQMRRRASDLAFAAGMYFDAFQSPHWDETALAIDSSIFWFRNDGWKGINSCAQGGYSCLPPLPGTQFPPQLPCHQNSRFAECPWGELCDTQPTYCDGRWNGGACLSGICGEATVYHVPEQVAEVAASLLPARTLTVGFYSSAHSALGQVSPKYVQNIIPIIVQLPRVDGVMSYTFHSKPPYQSTSNWTSGQRAEWPACDAIPTDCDLVRNVSCIAAHIGCIISREYQNLPSSVPL